MTEIISDNFRQAARYPPLLPVGNTLYSDSGRRRMDYLTGFKDGTPHENHRVQTECPTVLETLPL